MDISILAQPQYAKVLKAAYKIALSPNELDRIRYAYDLVSGYMFEFGYIKDIEDTGYENFIIWYGPCIHQWDSEVKRYVTVVDDFQGGIYDFCEYCEDEAKRLGTQIPDFNI